MCWLCDCDVCDGGSVDDDYSAFGFRFVCVGVGCTYNDSKPQYQDKACLACVTFVMT